MPDGVSIRETSGHPVSPSLMAAGLFSALLLLIYLQTTWSMVATWMRSDTYAHGFLILPISLWLVWIRREHIHTIKPRPAPWLLLLTIPLGFGWLLAWLVDVLVVQQLCLIAILVVGTSAIVGIGVARALAFPMLFLFLAVPMGEALVPPMMEFTATSTVWLIQQTGIPVYREGLYFFLPSGSWSVVEACSGVRYIIASITLGVLYAYLTYISTWRRVLFVLVSAVVPVIANTLRAYIIVMLGHMSDMTIATGVDHLIYGWAFFGLVVFLLFWAGSFFREEGDAGVDGVPVEGNEIVGTGATRSRIWFTALVALLAAGAWPATAKWSDSRLRVETVGEPILPVANGEWLERAESGWNWHPASAVAGTVSRFYSREQHRVGLFVQYPAGNMEDGEIVGSGSRYLPDESALRIIERGRFYVSLDGDGLEAGQAHIVGVTEEWLGWSWYRIGGFHTSNDYIAKFLEAWARLGFGAPGIYRVVIIMPVEGSPALTQQALEGFLNTHWRQLEQGLGRGVGVE